MRQGIYAEIEAEREARYARHAQSDSAVRAGEVFEPEANWLNSIYCKILSVPERFRPRGDHLRGSYPSPWAPDAEEVLRQLAETPAPWVAASRAIYRKCLIQIAELAVTAIEVLDAQYPDLPKAEEDT